MRLPSTAQHDRHDIRSSPGTGEVQRANPISVHGDCDLPKAFDTIRIDGLWQILRNIGCPDLFVDIIRSFHEGMVARVQDQGHTAEPFSVTNGTKQGCMMAPLSFTLVLSAMLNDAFHDNDLGALRRFRTDGNVNLRRLNSKQELLWC